MKLTVRVPDPVDTLTRYTHVLIYRAPAVLDPITGVANPGTFVEITQPVSRRIAIVADRFEHTFDDPDGSSADFYQVRYRHETTGRLSPPSRVGPNGGDPALEVLSVFDFQDYYLFGLDLTNDFGVRATPEFFAWYIRAAVDWLEIYLGIDLLTKRWINQPYDLTAQQAGLYNFLKLRRFPVQNVEQIQLVHGNTPVRTHTNPADWKLDPEAGQLHIFPAGNVALPSAFLPQNVLWGPAAMGRAKFVPHQWLVTYTSGWPAGAVPPKLREVVGRLAAMGPLNVFGDITLGAGLQALSQSLDGLTQSITTTNSSTNAGYGARIITYLKDLKSELPVLRAHYRAFSIAAV